MRFEDTNTYILPSIQMVQQARITEMIIVEVDVQNHNFETLNHLVKCLVQFHGNISNILDTGSNTTYHLIFDIEENAKSFCIFYNKSCQIRIIYREI